MRPNPAIAAIALSLLVASCSSQAGAAGAGTKVVPAAVSPLDGKQFYPDPKSNAAVEYRRLLAQGRQDEANEIKSLASTPSAIWFGGKDNPYARVDRILTAATKARQVPILVVYNVPGRDCGLYSAGGLAGIDPYLRWVGSFAAASKGREAIVILEPDAVPQSLSGCNENASSERHRTLELAVDILKRQPGLRVYLDAGNATWIKDQDRLATALRASNLPSANGQPPSRPSIGRS